ncbi:MAG: hypothetical protein ACI8Y7_000920 [Candidatus Woesearchaeota archaeon]|jgi:hypothetical protein
MRSIMSKRGAMSLTSIVTAIIILLILVVSISILISRTKATNENIDTTTGDQLDRTQNCADNPANCLDIITKPGGP